MSGIETLITLPDPIGKKLDSRIIPHPFIQDKSLDWSRVSTPLGLVLVIFESRPDVLVQLLSLAIKTGNGLICKGGKEAKNTLHTIYSCFQQSCQGQQSECFKLLNSHKETHQALQSESFDLCIPRGSSKLVQWVKDTCKYSVIGHGSGICCGYLHSDIEVTDYEIVNLVSHAKLHYPAACNALEVLYIHKSHISLIEETVKIWTKAGIQIIVGSRLRESLRLKYYQKDIASSIPIEYGDERLLVEVVGSHPEALQLINQYGSHHTDLILTDEKEIYNYFCRSLMSASVFQMVSTRCADGFRMGMGCELGINTNRSSWFRGPVGIEGLLATQIQVKPIIKD